MKVFFAGLSLALWFGILAVCSGCASTLQREGSFTLITDAQGLAAFSDYAIGVQNEATGKENYWKERDTQHRALTIGKGVTQNGK
jgi:hypothetical protein